MSDSQRGELTEGIYRGSGGYELVLSPVIMGFLGYLLDRWLGTVAVFTVIFATFALGWSVYKLTSGYNAEMAHHEANGPWAKRP